MNNKQFIHELSNRTSYTLEDTQRMVYDMIDSMNEKFMEGEPVNVTGFGTFEVKKRMERVIVNPSTGQRMLVPPKLVLSFKPNASVREKINQGGQQNG
jgi:DNA-binding protein HU-beta